MKDDAAMAEVWRNTLGSIYRDTKLLEGQLFAGLIDKDGKLRGSTVYRLIAAQHVMLDPVSVLLMCLHQKVKTEVKNFTFAICAPPGFPISVEAMGLIEFFEATQDGQHKVHFTRLLFSTVKPLLFRTVKPNPPKTTYRLEAAELIQIQTTNRRIPTLLNAFDLTAAQPNEKVHRLYMAAAFALVNHRFKLTSANGYNIGAILVSGKGQILSYGLNISNEQFFVHAELMAIYQYFRGTGKVTLPPDCRLYTTLKPCKMCAAYIVGRLPARPAGFKIFYGHRDNGEAASDTVLDRLNTSQRGPEVSVLIGSDGSKPLRSYVETEYVASQKEAHLHWGDAAYELSKVQYSQKERGIVIQLATKAPAEFPKITNSLLRKRHKYSDDLVGANANVRKALGHILDFLETLGVLAKGTPASLSIDQPLTEEEWRDIEAFAEAEESKSKKRRKDLEEARPPAPDGDPQALPFVLDPDEQALRRPLKRQALPGLPGLPGMPGFRGLPGLPNARPDAADGQDEFQ
jgi:tRNA(Arg) A34 adenosine deaminase TadA